MEGDSSLLSSLECSVQNNSSTEIAEHLQKIYAQSAHIILQNNDVFKTLLQQNNKQVLLPTVQVLSELTKIEHNRIKLTDEIIVQRLVELLNDEDLTFLVHVCRALGNLCFDNERARKYILRSNGLSKLLHVIEQSLKNNTFKLTTVGCGFLMNLLNDYKQAQEKALELNTLSLAEKILKAVVPAFALNEACCHHILQVLSLLTDNLTDVWFGEELCGILVKILEVSLNPEVSVLCLELCYGQAENDNIKFYFAKAGLCELLFSLLEQHKSLVNDEESRELMKLACDTIVQILTGDSSMELLYENGKGTVFQNMLSWLDSSDTDLVTTGVLAIGNFARNDRHCIQMVESNLSKKLLDMLAQHNKPRDKFLLQHALLSALRNLVIPLQNKKQILSDGLVDIVYPMLTIDQFPVVFKLLGTLRMAIDGQEKAALDLAMRTDFLEKLVDWNFTSDHLGVRGEASRLLAWLIKHCRSSEPYANIIHTKGCVKCLVEMIPSTHPVMQNEALLALNLICSKCLAADGTTRSNSDMVSQVSNLSVSPNLADILIDVDIGKCLTFQINTYHSKMEREVVENLLTLLKQLIVCEKLVRHLKSAGVSKELKQFLTRNSLQPVFEKINFIINTIDCG